MKKEELLEILHDWNFWKNELDIGKERATYLEKSLRLLKTNVVVAAIGVRRAGKSYLMRRVIKKLIEKGKKEGKHSDGEFRRPKICRVLSKIA